jgi:hypothetical protein
MILLSFLDIDKQSSPITWHQDFIEISFSALLPLVFAATFPAGRRLSAEDESGEFANMWKIERRFEPNMPAEMREKRYRGWRDALSRTLTRAG